MAVRPSVLGNTVPDGYRLLSLYFGSGLIDRTGVLEHGFPVRILDPMGPKPTPIDNTQDSTAALFELCDNRALKILERARSERKKISVLWSGGIDSTAALSALLTHVSPSDDIEICYSKHSVKEYPRYFKNELQGHKLRKIDSVKDALDPSAIIVTGEHGDQLFGSIKALPISNRELNKPWADAFSTELSKGLASSYRVDTVLRYIEPQVLQAPVPINTLWDLLWWLNFSMKWQHVTTRIPFANVDTSSAPEAQLALLNATEHFFRDQGFQMWSMANRSIEQHFVDWSAYKMPLKQYIVRESNDQKYLLQKTKEPSLQHVMSNSLHKKLMRHCFAIEASGLAHRESFSNQLRKEIPGKERNNRTKDRVLEIEYSRTSESSLWNDLGDSGE